MTHDQDDWTQRLKENPPDPLEYIRQVHEEWLTQLEGLALVAIATNNWEKFYAHVVDFQNEHKLHGETAISLATSQRLVAIAIEDANVMYPTVGQMRGSADELQTRSATSLSQTEQQRTIEEIKPIMTRVISTSAKDLGYYADGESPLETLVEQFGSRLEELDKQSKFLLLSSIGLYAAVDDDELYSLKDCYENNRLVEMNPDLEAMLPQLETLCADNLLGLCEALIAQLRYTVEVEP